MQLRCNSYFRSSCLKFLPTMFALNWIVFHFIRYNHYKYYRKFAERYLPSIFVNILNCFCNKRLLRIHPILNTLLSKSILFLNCLYTLYLFIVVGFLTFAVIITACQFIDGFRSNNYLSQTLYIIYL